MNKLLNTRNMNKITTYNYVSARFPKFVSEHSFHQHLSLKINCIFYLPILTNVNRTSISESSGLGREERAHTKSGDVNESRIMALCREEP
jgi:hypothetical protein